MSRISVAAVGLFAAALSLCAEVVTLPAAASIQGGNPFFSDVRVFNTSYASSLDVTATYRCFIATVACPGVPPQMHFTLAPRESKAFDDMVANPSTFGAHDTAGGVEFEFDGPEDQLVVTSRLFSTSPLNSVGMFIPGLHGSKAFATSVLTSIRHDPLVDLVAGFRTNVGAFNPGGVSAQATLTIFGSDGSQLGSPVARAVPPHSGMQVSGIFEAAGLSSLVTENATIVVRSNVPLFTYAAVLDNRTADPIFVVGAPDNSGPATPTPGGPSPTRTAVGQPSPTKTRTPMGGMPTPTRTPTRTPTQPGPSATPTPTQAGPTATRTPTQPGPTATNTPTSLAPTATPTSTRTQTATRTPTSTPLPNQVNIGPGIAFSPSTITITAGQTVNWVWMSGPHSTTSGSCPGGVCAPDGIWDSGVHTPPTPAFSHTFPSAGTFTYYCKIHLASMQGTVVVNP